MLAGFDGVDPVQAVYVRDDVAVAVHADLNVCLRLIDARIILAIEIDVLIDPAGNFSKRIRLGYARGRVGLGLVFAE